MQKNALVEAALVAGLAARALPLAMAKQEQHAFAAVCTCLKPSEPPSKRRMRAYSTRGNELQSNTPACAVGRCPVFRALPARA